MHSESENEIRDKVHELYLDQLSYREIVDKLAEKDYDRKQVIRVIHAMTKQKDLEPRYKSPIVFMILSVALLLWGSTHASLAASDAIKAAKIASIAVGGILILPSAFTVIYQWYDRIPGLRMIVEPFMVRQQLVKLDIATMDDQFQKDLIPDMEYENKLVALLGQERGKRHYRWMRNQKHFGIV